MTDDPHIRLIGEATGLTTSGEGGDDAVVAFYRSLIPRLCTEVSHSVEVSRLIGFRTEAEPGGEYRFLGIETNALGPIPEGMITLDLSDALLTVTAPGRPETIHPINRAWREETPLGIVGEFTAPAPLDLSSLDEKQRLQYYSLSVHAPVDVKEPIPESDAIELTDPDPAWPDEFARMADRLKTDFPEAVTRIEHYGSTAVPGIPAKPIIDILVETPSMDIARRALIPGLVGPEWEYWWYTDHMIFIRRREFGGTRTHHVHVAPAGHRLWEGIVFRDYLAAHPEAAGDYTALKRELSARYRTDREAYTDAKTAFIRGILERAKGGADG